MKEIWKDVKNYEGIYQVSNLGRVKSLARDVLQVNGVIKPIKERILRPCTDNCGYQHYRLAKEGSQTLFKAHRLVAMHFLPDYENSLSVNHINHNRWDNSAKNLEMLPIKENIAERSVKRLTYCKELDQIIIQPKRFFNKLGMNYSRYYFLKSIELKRAYNNYHFTFIYA